MASPSIVTKKVLEDLYPNADLDAFVPTHWVQLVDRHMRKVVREDAVVLSSPQGDIGIQYATCPGDAEPRYARVPPDRWQCLDRHGLVRARAVKYVPGYVRPSDRLGFVYFVQSGEGGPIKIGWSQDTTRRVAELQTANAHKLVLLGMVPGTMEDEAAMHVHFGHLRMEAEWFQNAPEIHAFIVENGSTPIAAHG